MAKLAEGILLQRLLRGHDVHEGAGGELRNREATCMSGLQTHHMQNEYEGFTEHTVRSTRCLTFSRPYENINLPITVRAGAAVNEQDVRNEPYTIPFATCWSAYQQERRDRQGTCG